MAMNEITFDQAPRSSSFRLRLFGTSENRQSSAFYGYSITTIALGIGWLLRDRNLISAAEGLGYWLGIIGGSMMLVLLLYPLRKRIRILRFLGRTAHWFQAHMILGVLGPVLVLYHSNFNLGSVNSKVALYCMLLVAGSGVIGRHIYAHIHSGLYGGKARLDELRRELTRSLEQSNGITALLPKFAAKLDALTAQVQGCSITGSLSLRSCFLWTFRQYTMRFSLWWSARSELRERAAASPAIALNRRKLQRATSSYIRRYVRQVGRVAQFTLYERMFSLWHVLHMPLFFMMVVSALFHVLAVHMY
jgi:hypothetical protein